MAADNRSASDSASRQVAWVFSRQLTGRQTFGDVDHRDGHHRASSAKRLVAAVTRLRGPLTSSPT